MVEGYESLVTTDKCLKRTPNMKVKLSADVCEVLYELRLRFGAEM
jgi:hypothetical protein